MYYKNQFNENQGNPKRQWKTINFLFGRTGSLNKLTIKLKSLYMDTSTKFNEHFLKNSLALDDDNYNYTKYLNNSQSFSMYLVSTNKTEVEKFLTCLNQIRLGMMTYLPI